MTTVDEVTGRGLVSGELFDHLVDRIAETEELPPDFAARIMAEALVFLYACAHRPDAQLTPSALVDIGWHAFILNTQEYAEFCHRVAGRFIHHVPDRKAGPGRDHHSEVGRTMLVIASVGLAVDPELWLARAAGCSDGDDGCRASGKDGNENSDTNSP